MHKRRDPFFDRALRALSLAAPIALASHLEDDFAHCLEASVAGAVALRDRTIDARAIPCAVMGVNKKAQMSLALGLNEKDVYGKLNWGDGPVKSFEEWVRDTRMPQSKITGDRLAMHVAIEARCSGEREIIDLTLGQLRQLYKIEIPLSVRIHCDDDDWPAFGTEDGWQLHYMASPHAEKIQEEVDAYGGHRGLVADLDTLMDLALQCGLDGDRFFRVLKMSQPKLFELAVSRLSKMTTEKGKPDVSGEEPNV